MFLEHKERSGQGYECVFLKPTTLFCQLIIIVNKKYYVKITRKKYL